MLDQDDWMRIQIDVNIATRRGNTFISLDEGFARDFSATPSAPVVLMASTFMPNSNPPILRGGIIFVENRILGLSFSEGVNSSSVDVTGISFSYTNRNTGLRQTYTLTGGGAVPGNTGNQVAVLLTLDDFDVVRMASPNASSVLLTIRANTVLDTSSTPNAFQGNVLLSEFFDDNTPPEINTFTLDLNTGMMNITFTEFIRTGDGDLNYSLFFLFGGDMERRLSLAGSTFLSATAAVIETIIEIVLPPDTLNTIRRDSNLCSSIENCFMVWGNNSFTDLSNIPAVESVFPSSVSIIVNDTVQPSLVTFDLDLTRGLLDLTFDEPVSVDAFSLSTLSFTDGASRQEAVSGTIDPGTATFSSNVSIMLSTASLNFVKSLRVPRLAILGAVTSDAAGNSVIEISTAGSIQPSVIIRDRVQPQLLGFLPDVPSTRRLALTFDEFVNSSSWDGNQLSLTLRVSAGDIIYSGFTTGTLSTDLSNEITYTFSSTNFTSVFGTHYTEAYSSGAILLQGGEGLIQDLAGNPLAASAVFTYSTQPDDTTPPRLTSFDLDMNLGRIVLTFSEPINVMNVSGQVQFINRGTLESVTQVYDLADTGVSNVTIGPVPVVELTLGRMDLNAIKVNRQLCTATNDTFIAIRSGLAQDRNENPVVVASGMQVANYVPDTSPPSILLFDLDVNTGNAVILFSEPVLTNSASLNFSQFFLGGSRAGQLMGADLGGGVITMATDFDSLLTVGLSLSTLNSIKFDRSVCTGPSDCFLYSVINSFRDPAGNTAMGATSGIPVQSYTVDTTLPVLVSFDLDLDVGTLSLTFSEPVDVPTFDLTALTFLSDSTLSVGTEQYSPVEATVPVARSMNTQFSTMLAPVTLNNIKSLSTRNPGNVFLSLAASAARDFATPPNSIIPILNLNSLPVNQLTPDVTAPTLLRFTPASPNPNDITFTFDEVVDQVSFSESAFMISLTTRQGTFEYSSFNGGSTMSNVSTGQLVYTFSTADFNATLSAQYAEAVSNGSVSLLAGNGLVTDVFGNSLPQISTPIQFSTDSTRPTLVSYTLDLNMGLMGLSFSEPVNILAVGLRATLQNRAVSPEDIIQFLSNGTLNPASAASDVITLQIGINDLNTIKSSGRIGTSRSNTFLSLAETFAMDLSGNLILPATSAVQVSSVIPDTSRPTLSSFNLDINLGRVVLEFSESIMRDSLNVSRLYLMGMPQSQPLGGYDLSNSTFSEPSYPITVMLTLPQDSLNRVKSDIQVCTSRSNCFIFVNTGAATDVSGNQILPSTSGTLASVVVADSVPPQLTAYTMDLDSGSIVLTFSEPILVTGFNPTGVTAQAAGQSQQLGSLAIQTAESFNTVLRLTASSSLLNQLKFLATSGAIAVSVNSNTATDTTALPVVAIPPTAMFAPSSFVPDTTPPSLLRFIPSSGQLGMTLMFDEFVQPSTLAANLLSFRLKNRNGQFDYANLTSAIITAEVSDRVTITFPTSEARFTDSSFLQLYFLSFSEGSICLNLAPSFITDVSGNGYSGDLLTVYTNSSDTEQPRLVSYTLNLNSSVLSLAFSESVNALMVGGNVRFQDGPTSSTVMYTIMNGTVLTTQDSSLVTITIDPADLANLMNLPTLATSIANTYLFLSERFAVDFSGNFLNTTQGAIQASEVVQVVRGTTILSFDLDLDSDIMTLEFDRGVNISTFNSSRITLTNTSSSAETSRVDVQLGSVELLTPPGAIVTTFRFLLGVSDAINVKRSILCYQRSNCFASFMRELARDTTGNYTFPVLLQVRNLFLDVTPPRLVAYREFDLDRGTFTLIFSEPVNGSSASFTDVQFSDRITNPTVNLTLREGFTTPDNLEIDFSIVRRDLNAIKIISGLCTSRDNCWVRLPSFFINDVGMNPFLHSNITPDAQASFHQPIGFIDDVTPPTLLSYDSDINAGSMTLSFSEVIQETSFYPENITLLNAPNGGVSLQLSGDTPFNRSVTGDVISLTFTRSDLNYIKSQNQLFNTSYISLVSRLLVDTSGNVLTAFPLSSPLQVSQFVPDTIRPNLVAFDLYNNDNGSIVVTFDEPVEAATVNFTGFTLIAHPIGSPLEPSTLTLTGGSVMYKRPLDRLTLVLSMTSADLRAVKLITNLATGRENTYISILPDTVRDWSGNQVVGVPLSAPLQLSADGFVSDSSRASMAGYTFDLNAATISLTFTDILDIATLDLTQLTVQSNRSPSPSVSYTLMDSSTTSTNTDTFVVNLGTQDLTAIQSNLGLATMESNTYISFSSSLVRDVSGLEVVAIQASSAVSPAVYIPDTSNPTLVAFSLDMNTGNLSMTFSEPILVSTLMLQSVTMQNSALATPTMSYTLTNSSHQAEGPTTTIVPVAISYEDLNAIKSSMGLASSRIDTFISLTPNFTSDTSMNLIQSTAMQVMSYIPDTIPPTLLSFDLRLTGTGTIELHFSEAVSYSFGVQRNIVLQNTPFNPSVFRMLSQADSIITLPVLDTVQIMPSRALLVDLLSNAMIAASTSTLYLSIAGGSFSDFAGNQISPIPSNGAMKVQFICKLPL
jgi:hypothetical protein